MRFRHLCPTLSSVSADFARSARCLHGYQDRVGPPAFAFDIDGVLVKGGDILDPAKKALSLLYEGKGIGALPISWVLPPLCLKSCIEVLTCMLSILTLLVSAQDRPQFPVCFMTNGGGVTEAEKAEQLSEWLNVAVHANQVSVNFLP